jgi:hypothetical protein
MDMLIGACIVLVIVALVIAILMAAGIVSFKFDVRWK